jgi:hypothetical protein
MQDPLGRTPQHRYSLQQPPLQWQSNLSLTWHRDKVCLLAGGNLWWQLRATLIVLL